jgi:hypothetical protein
VKAFRTKKILLTLALLAVFGLLRVPFENRIQKRLIADELLNPPPEIGLLDQMGQAAFLATLGGTRSLVAVYMTLMAYDSWRFQDWEELNSKYTVVTSLRADDEEAWIIWAWHNAYNASANMETNPDWREFRRSEDLTREDVSARFIDRGVEILRDGIRNNPESGKLYQELGRVMWKKDLDPCGGAIAYEKAKNLPGSLGFTVRFQGYCMAECPGREQEAYEYLSDLYHPGQKHRTPSVIVALKKLEETLDVPFTLRIPDWDPDRRLRHDLEMNDAGSNMPWIP